MKLFKWFKPLRTPESVAEELIHGLENGSITAGCSQSASAVESGQIVLFDIEALCQQLVVAAEGSTNREQIARLLKAILSQLEVPGKQGHVWAVDFTNGPIVTLSRNRPVVSPSLSDLKIAMGVC